MFIEQAYKGLHESWRYLIGTLLIITFFLIGQVPITLAILIGSFSGNNAGIVNSTKAMMEVSGLSSNMFTFLLLISFAIGLLGVYIVVKYLHHLSWRHFTTTRKKIDWRRFFFSFGLIGLFILISTLYDYYTHPDNFVLNFELVPFLILLVIGVIMVPLQTSFEEYFFRGYLMQGLGLLTKNRWFPLLLTSILFGLAHSANPEVDQLGPMIMFFYIGTGLLLGILTLMDDGMELSMGFHAGNNLIMILLVTSDWSAFQTESILKDISDPTAVGGEVFIPLLIVYPIFLIIMAKKYHWKNWRKKLFGKLNPPAVDKDPKTDSI